MRRFALPFLLLALAACVGPQQPFLYKGTPTLRVAKAAMSSGAPEIALNVANTILDTKPYDVPAQVMKGDALYALGLFPLSQSAYQGVLKLEPANPAAHLGLGRIKLSDHDPAAAEREFRAALQGEMRPETISNLGVSLDLQKRPAEAQAEYRRALEIDPGSAATRLNLARSLLSTGDVAGASTALQPVVDAQPNALLSPDVSAVRRMIEEQSGSNQSTAPEASAAADASPPLARPPRAAR